MENTVLIIKPEVAALENDIAYDVKQAGLRIIQVDLDKINWYSTSCQHSHMHLGRCARLEEST